MTLALSGTEPKGFKLYNMQRQTQTSNITQW